MSLLRALRLLVLGETAAIPGGLVLVLVVAAGVRAAAPALWERAGGAVVLAGALLVLAASVLGRRPRD